METYGNMWKHVKIWNSVEIYRKILKDKQN